MSEDVIKWMKRLNRKGPFYLLRTEEYKCQWRPENTGSSYVVIWNDGHKTKIGNLHDHMSCRYGINTWSVLNGDRPHDLWNGSNVSDDDFAQMLAVRNDSSILPTFDLADLRHLSW